MRKLLGALVVLVVLAGSGISVLWMLQSAKIEKNITSQVAQFNSGPVKFTYDALEITGFPLHINIALVNPKLAGRMDALLDPNKQKNLPEWTEDASLQGNIVFGIDAFSSHVVFNMNGAWKNTSTLGTQKLSLTGAQDTSLQCTIDVEQSLSWPPALWNFAFTGKSGSEFLTNFRLFDCYLNRLQFNNGQTNALLMQSGSQRFHINSDPQGAQRLARLYIKGVDSFVTQEGDQMLARYYRALMPQAVPPMLSAYGKQNGEIDLSYVGPIDWQGDTKSMPIEVHLGRFNVTNDAYTINSTFDLTNNSDAQNQASRVAFKSEITYNQIYTALLHETVRGIIAQILSDPKISLTTPSIKDKYTPESLYALIEPAIPNLYALGKSTTALDVSYQGAAGFTAGDFTLAELELSVVPYGLTGKGNGKRAAGALMPTANVVINCRNCLQMANDLMLYTNRLHDITLTLAGVTSLPYFDERTIQGYKGFLQALAEDDGAGNFSYAIVSDGSSSISINKRRMDEILVMYHKFMPMQKR